MGLQEKEKKNSLREQMPCVAAFIDELRSVFGEEEVNKQIRLGMAGKPTFHASEGVHEIGTHIPEGVLIGGKDLILPVNFELKHKGRK